MSTRWDRFYQRKLQDKEIKALVEAELQALQIGVKIAKLREEEKLTQTRLASRAGMPSSKISAIENSTPNLTVSTLIKIAQAANRKLEIHFVR
jgi:DNA-binding XRE family transcriptional regulator